MLLVTEISCEIGTCFLLVRVVKTNPAAAPALTATTPGTAGQCALPKTQFQGLGDGKE